MEAQGDARGGGAVSPKWRNSLYIAAKAAMVYFDAEAKRRRLGRDEKAVRRMLRQGLTGGKNG